MRIEVPQPPDGAVSKLRNWFSGGISAKTVVFVGDSTTSNATTLFSEDDWLEYTGQRLDGVTFVNRGQNGYTIAAWLAAADATFIPQIVADNPKLLVLCFGINDVRLGATSMASLRVNIVVAVNKLRTALPNVPIVLWTPNSLTTDDVGGNGFVTATGLFTGMTVAAAAQAATDMLWFAYDSLRDYWPEVLVVDKQIIFGRVCVASTATSLMTDQLHPNNAGQRLELKQIADVIGYRAGFSSAASAVAWTQSPSSPWTVYSRALEDPAHTTLQAQGGAAGAATQGAGFFDMLWPLAGQVAVGDKVQFGVGGPVFTIPAGSTSTQLNATTTRVFGMGASYPTTSCPNATQIYVWR